MQGKILDFNNEVKSGFLRDESGNRYHFFIGDCINPEKLEIGANVDFEHDGEKAIDIIIMDRLAETSTAKARLAKKMAENKMTSMLLILILILTIGGLIAIEIVSNVQKKKMDNVEAKYESQIALIQQYLLEGDCSSAASQYSQAKDTRSEIYKYGSYYSIQTHAQRGHEIEIAECFANKNDFSDAVKMLDINSAQSADYFNRASMIYQKAGDTDNAQEAHMKAQQIIP